MRYSIAPRTGAEFGFPFARIGLTMESCSSFFLPRMVGYSNATYLLTTGARYPADAPVLNGIFAELVDAPQDVLPRAVALAEDIVTNVSPMAAYLNRQLIWRNAGSAEGAHLVDSPLLYDMFAGRYVQHRLAQNDFVLDRARPAVFGIMLTAGQRSFGIQDFFL